MGLSPRSSDSGLVPITASDGRIIDLPARLGCGAVARGQVCSFRRTASPSSAR